ncbi:hypothetical protein ABKN59_005958 [Abortiporus biennis]
MTRGRRKDLTIPPSRALLQQRDYRARKAQYVADLEDRNKRLEDENMALHREIDELKHRLAQIPGGGAGLNQDVVSASADLMQHLTAAASSLARFQRVAFSNDKSSSPTNTHPSNTPTSSSATLPPPSGLYPKPHQGLPSSSIGQSSQFRQSSSHSPPESSLSSLRHQSTDYQAHTPPGMNSGLPLPTPTRRFTDPLPHLPPMHLHPSQHPAGSSSHHPDHQHNHPSTSHSSKLTPRSWNDDEGADDGSGRDEDDDMMGGDVISRPSGSGSHSTSNAPLLQRTSDLRSTRSRSGSFEATAHQISRPCLSLCMSQISSSVPIPIIF